MKIAFAGSPAIFYSLFLILALGTCRLQVSASPAVRDTLRPAIDNLLNQRSGSNYARYRTSAAFSNDTSRIGKYLRQAWKQQSLNYDSAAFLSGKALSLSLEKGNAEQVSAALQILGRTFMFREDYTTACDCYLHCLRIEEFTGNEKGAADINNDLGLIYYYQEVFARSLQYFEKALKYYLHMQDTLNIARTYSYIGNLHSSREFCENRDKEQKKLDFNLAIGYLEKTKALCQQIGFKPLMISAYVSLASVYNKLDQPERALPLLQDAISYYHETAHFSRMAGTLHTLGKTYFKLKDYSRSISSFKESQALSEKYHLTDGIQYLFEAMAQTYEAAGDYKNAYWTYIRYMTLRDSLVTAEKSRALFELETKYQSEKKEKEIIRLNAEKREKNQLLIALTILLFILLVLGYFILKNIRNRKTIAEQSLRIKEQQILDMQKERQLIATKSVLQGEEAERSRMARDLHDGLGGLLSSVKINLSSMKGNSIITDENADAFNHAITLLDHSISELRRVAHNMMPETLVHYGLNAAYRDFVDRIRTDNTPAFEYQFFGKELRYSSELEITLFRIGQELVNNALKHSGAKKISIQFFAEPARLCLQVIDNGTGYDTSLPVSGKGIANIRDRIAANNGRFEIWSKPGEGTEATVEFLLP